MNFQELIKTNDYDFLRQDTRLQNNIILLGLGGSYAYRTNTETSDIDIRGIAVNDMNQTLLGRDFEVIENKQTDTVIYSLLKAVKLLSECNPNVIEILGLKPDQYLVKTKAGQMLFDNKQLFLSRKAINTFGGYTKAQLGRIRNAFDEKENQTEEELVLNRLKATMFPEGFSVYSEDKTLFVDAELRHYNLGDFMQLYDRLNALFKSAKSLGDRNSKALAHNKMAKHSMHLVRLYYMAFDILEKQEINTYREKEHDLLMDIRNGKYLKDNRPTDEFYELLDELEKRFEYAKENTSLPNKPDKNSIDNLVLEMYNEIQAEKKKWEEVGEILNKMAVDMWAW